MVQVLIPEDPYPALPGRWCPRTNKESRCSETELPSEPTVTEAITQTLRYYGVLGSIFIAAADENGRVVTHFASAEEDGVSINQNHAKFFDEPAFVEACRAEPDSMQLDEPELGLNTENSVRDDLPHRAGSSVRGRGGKRSRAVGRQRINEGRPDALPVTTTEPRRSFAIGDADAVYAFYDNCLRSCQQTACKTIAKAWVKAVAPKKQSTNPYTKGDEKRPDWWPAAYRNIGDDCYRYLRHKEPDHIHRDERVYLLCHILRMLVEPREKQHPAIRKVELTLSTLEANTFEVLAPWFADRDSPANMAKKPLLRDLFRIASQEAQYRDGEIDGNTLVYVTPLSAIETNRDLTPEDEEDTYMKEEYIPYASEGGMLVTRDSYEGHDQTGGFASQTLPGPSMIGVSQYPNPGFGQEMPERPSYEGLPAMSSHIQPYGPGPNGLHSIHINSHESCQQPPVLSDPATYGGQMAYTPWPVSHTQAGSSLYAFPPESPGVQGYSGQITHGISYLNVSTGGLPSPQGHYGDAFASPMGGMQHPPNYGHYTPEGGVFVTPEVKTERPLSPFRIKTEHF